MTPKASWSAYLATRFPRDREAYIGGKSARVAAILPLARRK